MVARQQGGFQLFLHNQRIQAVLTVHYLKEDKYYLLNLFFQSPRGLRTIP